MTEELKRKVLALRTRMYKEIDAVLQKIEKEIIQLNHENQQSALVQ